MLNKSHLLLYRMDQISSFTKPIKMIGHFEHLFNLKLAIHYLRRAGKILNW